MNRIITLTINPALDKSVTVDELVPDKKLRAAEGKTEPGGGGVNVSRALYKLGISSQAVYFSGGYPGKHFDQLLQEEGITVIPLPIKEDTRENFIVTETAKGNQYRFGMEGPHITDTEWKQVLTWLHEQSGIEFLVVSGSLAPGVPPSIMAALAGIAREKGAKLIADTSGEALEEVVRVGAFLLKPNLGELAKLVGRDHLKGTEVATAAKELITRGAANMIAVSMGADGAIMVTADGIFEVKAPEVEKRSTVGAGDSMVAGMLYGLTQQWPAADVLAYGVACGSAATMNEGTELCKKPDADRLFKQMKQV